MFHTHDNEEHFCEIELLQMLGSEGCSTCDTATSSIINENREEK
jgi:zinc transport system ATP-binding protein